MNIRLGLTILAAVFVVSFASYLFGRADGAQITRAAWTAEKKEIQERSAKAIADAIQENETALAVQKETARKISDEYETKILALDAEYSAARAARGLRLPAAVCSSSGAVKAAPAGAGKPNEARTLYAVPEAPGIRIPALTEAQIYALARDADELAARLEALQEWIRLNGLY